MAGRQRRKPSTGKVLESGALATTANTSDSALASLLERLKQAADPDEIRELSDQIERLIFHKQFMNA